MVEILAICLFCPTKITSQVSQCISVVLFRFITASRFILNHINTVCQSCLSQTREVCTKFDNCFLNILNNNKSTSSSTICFICINSQYIRTGQTSHVNVFINSCCLSSLSRSCVIRKYPIRVVVLLFHPFSEILIRYTAVFSNLINSLLNLSIQLISLSVISELKFIRTLITAISV